jgi:ribosomal protein L17
MRDYIGEYERLIEIQAERKGLNGKRQAFKELEEYCYQQVRKLDDEIDRTFTEWDAEFTRIEEARKFQAGGLDKAPLQAEEPPTATSEGSE